MSPEFYKNDITKLNQLTYKGIVMSIQLLTLNEVKQSITMSQAIMAMERAFIQLGKAEVALPLRTGIAITKEQALTLTMPAYLEQDHALGLKVVSIFPNNSRQNKPSITGFITLLDAHTGEPIALMDAAFLTALRTGAVTGLATKYFAAKYAQHLAIIGSGVQAETQLEAVTTVRDIKQISIWSRNHENAQKFADKFAPHYEVNVCASIPLAIRDADIICTATGSHEALIHLNDVPKHAHINAIGSHTPEMKEISSEVLEHAVVIVDQLTAALAESGEIIHALAQGQLKKETIIELGNWLLHQAPDYQNKLTVFKSVGLSIQDVSIASVVYQNAMAAKLGTAFEFN